MKPRTLCILTLSQTLLLAVVGVLAVRAQSTRVDYQKQLANFPTILKVERATCSGSGNSLDAQGNKIPYNDPATGQQKKDAQGNLLWMQYDCAGLQYFKFTLADGSVRMYEGIQITTLPTTNSFVTWTVVPLTPSNPQ